MGNSQAVTNDNVTKPDAGPVSTLYSFYTKQPGSCLECQTIRKYFKLKVSLSEDCKSAIKIHLLIFPMLHFSPPSTQTRVTVLRARYRRRQFPKSKPWVYNGNIDAKSDPTIEPQWKITHLGTPPYVDFPKMAVPWSFLAMDLWQFQWWEENARTLKILKGCHPLKDIFAPIFLYSLVSRRRQNEVIVNEFP